jgi:hypothetical protein
MGKEAERKVLEQMPQVAAAIAVSKLGEKIAQQAKESGALRPQDEVDTLVDRATHVTNFRGYAWKRLLRPGTVGNPRWSRVN